mgnify:CR=1 FL=1
MDIGIITVKGIDYHPNQRLREAARGRGLHLECIDPYSLLPGISSGRLTFSSGMPQGLPRVVLPRQGAQIGSSSLIILTQLQCLGIPLVNGPAAIRIASNKFWTLQVLAAGGLRVPDTLFANSAPAFWSGIERLGGYPLVGKAVSSRQGRDVELLKGPEAAEWYLHRHLDPARGLLLQRFLPPRGRRDFRVLVIGGRVVGSMELQACAGDFRSNFHVSGWSRPTNLGAEQERIALDSVRLLGLSIAGVDLIEDSQAGCLVLEVNSTPGFKGLEAASGLDIADAIIVHAASFMR